MDASLMKASALRLRFSQSLASRRQRLSQAMVRSTTQRLGWTTKPFTCASHLSHPGCIKNADRSAGTGDGTIFAVRRA